MSTLNPLEAAERISASYKRYLRSRHAPRDAGLRNDFEKALNDFALTRGPLLQASPPFESSASIRHLVNDGTLHEGFLQMKPDAFPIDQPLYRHQEEAIRKALAGRNLIVATGTGSGKTECYLFPILNQLLQERGSSTLGSPGVRAMLLYPMNALANDQMKRLRDVLSSFPEITFGRFVGDTSERDRDALEKHRGRLGSDPHPNELISREQMRATPPHILLTNYAMLEYLLLRPADTTLFDGPTGRHWRFIVLDEVHVYHGAQGAEIAMLLRRVRDRVNGSQQGRIQYVGTSATLVRREEDYPRLAEYARDLFDEVVEYEPSVPARQDIVLPRQLPLVQRTTTWRAEPADFAAIRAHLDRAPERTTVPGDLTDRLASRGAPKARPGQPARDHLEATLATESHVVRLQRLLGEGAVDLAEAAQQVFHETAGRGHGEHLVDLVDVCARLHAPGTPVPLLPARYHFFVRALEGAFLCRSPDHPDGKPRLLLRRHDQCPGCERQGNESRMFESGVCTRCGAAYLLGVTRDDDDGNTRLQSARPDESNIAYLLLAEDVIDPDEADEDEQAVVPDDVGSDTDQRTLCTRCSSLTEGHEACCDCGRRSAVPVTVAHPAQRGEPLRRCIACTGRSNGPIVLRFLTGQDAPVAVIATALYQSLPPSRDDGAATLIGEGRKLLSFSDSRQDAAFFAPYLDRTYSQAVQRRLIWMTAERLADQEPRFEDLVGPIRKEAERRLVLDEDDGAMRNRNRVRTWLMREILAVDRRQSLDGVGLAEIGFVLPRGVHVPPQLLALGFSESEALDIARVLLETLRLSAAVHLPEGVEIDDPAFTPRNVVTRVRVEGSAPKILSWLPGLGLNRRLDYQQKVLEGRSLEADPRDLLEQVWTRWLAAPNSQWMKILKAVHHRTDGVLHAIDPARITIRPASDEEPAHRCGTCRQVWWRSVSRVCPSYRCSGTLEPLRSSESTDHYRHLYTSLDPIGMRVAEHTGQLGAEYAGELQQKFLDGEVNVLSCSTTFELGVDVGEVQGILMRNVPPSPANYVQRAGRAGRRTGSTALAVTFAQRRSHDLHYFRNPRNLIEGRIGVPIISLRNSHIIRRHIHAVAFAEFERRHVADGGEWHRTVASFFTAEDESEGSPVRQFVDWLRTHPSDLGDAVRRITPSDVTSTLGIEDWAWVEALTEFSDGNEDHGWLRRTEAEVVRDLDNIGDEIADVQGRIGGHQSTGESRQAEQLAGYQKRLFRVQTTLRERRLIDFLAQRVVLPKYGFPVDVVSLDVWRTGDRQASRLDLSRDLRLGLTEYAPGSRVVADGALWETTGLRIPPGLALVEHSWARCKSCDAFRTRRGEEPGTCEDCPGPARNSSGGRFVIPMFGFIGRRCEEKPGEARPPRAGYADFHFSDYMSETPPFRTVDIDGGRIRIRTSPQGQITAINRGPAGRGFQVCFTCGHAEPAPARRSPRGERTPAHRRPGTGRDCGDILRNVHLGHQYLTDVVESELPPMTTERARSTLYALLEGVSAIGIARRDVNGTLRPSGRGGRVSLVLFDAVPGGAGHAARIAERLPDLLWAARRVVEDCECGLDSSCYGCLRSYGNQRFHDELVRGDALEVLKRLLAEPD